jgi:hypothetical protein
MRKLTLRLAVITLAFPTLCGSLAAQTQDLLSQEEPITDSRYISETPASKGYALEFDSKATRDDNILNNNANRVSDYLFQEGAVLDLWETKDPWSIDLQYLPSGVFYKENSALNAADQAFKFDGSYHAARNLQFQVTDSFQDIKGILQSPSNEYSSVPTGPPPNLNATLLTPLARQLANQAELNVVYEITRRSAIDLLGSYALTNFSSPPSLSTLGSSAQNLFNTQTGTGGLGYRYRVSRHFTLGGRYLFEYFHYGQASPDRTHGMFLTALWQVGPHVELSLFGGAQLAMSGGAFLFPGSTVGSGPTPGPTRDWVPVGGASLTLRSNQTVLVLTGERIVTDGGGLLTTVINEHEGAELRRRIPYGFDFVWTGTNARSSALDEFPGTGRVDTQSAGMSIEHLLFQNLNLHVEYDFLRQRANQFVPFEANANANQYTVGISYRIGNHKS